MTNVTAETILLDRDILKQCIFLLVKSELFYLFLFLIAVTDVGYSEYIYIYTCVCVL